ncbi:EEF1A lysine methyltransferase 2 isoform X2 [Exaiptasia diaphana]|uniref:Protein-lysine N-methyltransferase n=1 Tax=Exaiptasia diaphana TaxID=2652724 RepID=A0A913XZP1_EXADI|nr:EEF1A lysine methyltransferase 2 isoform X2 [Exaiptasia diaphana]
MADEEEELNPSQLGTKEYWDNTYKEDLQTYKDSGDVGEIWFGEVNMNRIVKWIKKSPQISSNSSMLDLGCGNGMLFITLECDILDLANSELSGLKFDVCFDKGTYDAISLNPQDRTKCRAAYIQSVSSLLEDKGVFMITSCNWSKDELLKQFEKDFVLRDELPTPSFTFGGNSGNTVTSLVFNKRT